MTRFQRIPGVACETTARRLVVVNLALRVDSARSYARVLAIVVDASFRLRAIRVLHALRSATLVRIADVIGQAGARASAVTFFALGVHAARRRVAWHLHREDDCEARKCTVQSARITNTTRHSRHRSGVFTYKVTP